LTPTIPHAEIEGHFCLFRVSIPHSDKTPTAPTSVPNQLHSIPHILSLNKISLNKIKYSHYFIIYYCYLFWTI